jgi:hypothetical protein
LSYVYGQQKTNDRKILFRGVVISSSTSERLAGSQILINNLFRSSSRDDGTFSFFAFPGDTIVFTMLGYKRSRLIVGDTLKAREFLTGVYMQNDTLQIGEVIILPRFSSLRAEVANAAMEQSVQMENARSNLTIAAYQGRTGQGKLGDPALNYEILRQRQKIQAYEKGGIPSDRIVGISPFMLIPAAYLLFHGMPEPAQPPEPRISPRDIEELNRRYFETAAGKK